MTKLKDGENMEYRNEFQVTERHETEEKHQEGPNAAPRRRNPQQGHGQQKRKKQAPKTGAKTAKKVAAIVVAVTITLGAGATGAYYGNKIYTNYKTEKVAAEIVNTNADYYGYGTKIVHLGNTVVTKGFDVKVCEGEQLINVLNEEDIDVCEIDGNYYTNDGKKIAVLEFDVTREEYYQVSATKLPTGEIIYSLPEGASFQNGQGRREYTNKEYYITLAREDQDYSNYVVEGEGIVSSELNEENIREIPTQKFSALQNSTLILDVDTNSQTNNGNYDATYTLVKHN